MISQTGAEPDPIHPRVVGFWGQDGLCNAPLSFIPPRSRGHGWSPQFRMTSAKTLLLWFQFAHPNSC